jgi:hypothetical protein
MKSGGANSSSTLVDLSKTFARNAVVPKPKGKKKGSNRSGNVFPKSDLLI